MAAPLVISGTKLLILVGDSAVPEVFGQPCGLTTRTFDLAASTNTTLIPDCDDPDAPAWEAKDINALSAAVTGAGVMAIEAFATWNNWFMAAVSKNAQIKLDDPALGYWAGSFILNSLKFSGSRGNKVLIDISLVNNGAVVWNG